MIHQQLQRQRRDWTPRTQPRIDYTSGHSIQRGLEENSWNLLCDSDPTQEQMDSPTDDALLDEYNLKRLDPRDTWGKKQLHEFGGFVALEEL